MNNVKDIVLLIGATVGTFIAKMLGGWDAALNTLGVLMVADILTGVMVALVFKRSNKTEMGGCDSRAGFKGLCRKFAVFIIVWIATSIETALKIDFLRTGVILFFIGNEGLSLVENVGLMGVPYPKFLKDALEVLKEKGDTGGKSENN